MIGYHGTAYKNVAEILDKGFTANFRRDHWLGQGFYFYTDFDLAKWWIETKIKHNNERSAVIEAKIEVALEFFLDLDTRKGVDTFFDWAQEIYNHDLDFSFKMDAKNRTQNLCLALDLVKHKFGIKVVRRTFLKDNPSYGKQNIEKFENDFFPLPKDFAYIETQICVSDNDCVLHKECCYVSPPRRRTW
ncbi:MAG: hypothetical protein RL329_1893 [Bacteroidota bacterium]|jgi:hypothetical protein